MVTGAGIGVAAGRCPDRPRIPVHLLRVEGKQLRRLHDSDCRRPNGDFDGPLCARAASDVCRSTRDAGRRTARARLVVGTLRPSRHTAGPDLEAARRGAIPETETSGYAEYQTKVKYRLAPFVW